ncbi:GNAT family N-acetyltransferase [Nonomuraea sp. SMC257]|uniref:GNAT family N-acetyltransferase n=1 Tax=Nonomuraea montanisoli TaxID=2741721 RepID=A0A7Y6IA86_9ACTN|nr:GNAT family N-acetyltransferase [Nonomuraea montanisoli]NUW34537.1 GNAT family N-acetyltransferase [Nonomuraea montanisoli]
MPSLVPDALPAGKINGSEQPVLAVRDGVMLRPWQMSDSGFLMDAFRDPGIIRWYARTMADRSEAELWIQRWHDRWAREVGAGWVIESDGTAVGQAHIRDLSLSDGLGRFSCWVVPTARRRGFRTQACQRLVRWAFDDIGLNRLESTHSTQNPRACDAAVKAGFPYEGTLHRKALYPDGWHDLHLHAIVNENSGDFQEEQPL